MKILQAAHLGFCFGVRNAINLALDHPGPITVLGDLVHNEIVLRELRSHGVQFADSMEEIVTPAVMITAHGASDRARNDLERRGLRVVEATCPLVRHAHAAIGKLAAEGYHPVVVGKRNHVEVRGLSEDLPECDIVLAEDDVMQIRERPRFGVISQTTQPIERVLQLVLLLRKRFPASEVRFVDTVCQPTKLRQTAAIEVALQSDAVVVIGGAHSNNTRELVATCSRYCARVHHVQAAEDLREEWFLGVETAGLTAGTSTPEETIQAVENRLRQIGSRAGSEAARDPDHGAKETWRQTLSNIPVHS